MTTRAPSIEEIQAAAGRLNGLSLRTPILESEWLNSQTGVRAYIKPETLQRTGSFKFRGAYNRLSQLNPVQRAAGVVAWSSGNHAQGIAAAARLLGVSATIVMPKDAPQVKVAKVRDFGAEVITYNRYSEDREEIGRNLALSRGAVLVPSYDDIDIITGQATVGLEMAQDLAMRDIDLDELLVCCGGGGLIAGISSAFSVLSPSTKIYSVEPCAYDDHARSLKSGHRERNIVTQPSLCDALLAEIPGNLTFEINKILLAGGLTVTDDEVRDAMRFAYSEFKLVVEPSGAVALAALMSRKIQPDTRTVGVILSGANVDAELFASIINNT